MKAAIKYLVSVLGVLLLATTEALYSRNSAVIDLDEKSFKSRVLKDDGVWLVEFYAPWCGHCRNLVPEWEKSASALKGIVNVAAVDATQHQGLAQKYQIQGFPTIKIFGADKTKPTDYQSGRTSKAIVDEALRTASQVAKARLSGKGKKSSSSSSDGGSNTKQKRNKGSKSEVVTLTEDNFADLVYGSKDLWLVEFYAPWCGHCKALAPEWEQAASELKGSVRLGAVDATAHQSLASQFGIRGYPTIKVFAPGSTSPSDAEDYQGPRQADGIVAFALDKNDAVGGGAAPLTEITSQSVFEDLCAGTKKSCVIAALPNIIESGKANRDNYLKMLESLASKHKKAPFVFGWVEGGQQQGVEETLGLTFGYPAVVAVNVDKKRSAIQRGTFDADGIEKFLIALSSGAVRAEPYGNDLKFKTVAPWDGTEPVIEEEESLADIMGEDWAKDFL